MSELSHRMLRDIKLAVLVRGPRGQSPQAVRQPVTCSLVSLGRVGARPVEPCSLDFRDELGMAAGTLEPSLAGRVLLPPPARLHL